MTNLMTREEIEGEIASVMNANTHVTEQKTNQILGIIASILLDIRDLLANPIVKRN